MTSPTDKTPLERKSDEEKRTDAAWSRLAKARTPEEWRAYVDKIQNKVIQAKTACIIWWDHFGRRKVSEAWTHLDEFMKDGAWRGADNDLVCKELILIGYPEKMAERRVKEEQDDGE